MFNVQLERVDYIATFLFRTCQDCGNEWRVTLTDRNHLEDRWVGGPGWACAVCHGLHWREVPAWP